MALQADLLRVVQQLSFCRDMAGVMAVLRQSARELSGADGVTIVLRDGELCHYVEENAIGPLAPLRNALHVLRLHHHLRGGGGEGEDASGRTLELMDRQVQLLARIVDDLLDVARISSGQVALRSERVDLSRLVRHSVEDRRDLLEGAGLELDVELPETPVWILGDPLRLAQALGNTLENAGKFTPSGGRVTVRLALNGQAVVTIRDTGIGIEPEVLPHIFEVFAQGHQPLDRRQGGLGLGLAVSKALVELHGGEIRAASAGAGQGTEFTLRLPREEEPPALSEGARPAPPKKHPLQILVVEDNEDAAESLRLFLEFYGYEVSLAYTGPDGVAAAKTVRPDVVLCDIGLPGMDGFQVAAALRRTPETAAVRLIAVTGYGQEEDRRRALEAGFDVHLVKPVDPQKLLGYLN